MHFVRLSYPTCLAQLTQKPRTTLLHNSPLAAAYRLALPDSTPTSTSHGKLRQSNAGGLGFAGEGVLGVRGGLVRTAVRARALATPSPSDSSEGDPVKTTTTVPDSEIRSTIDEVHGLVADVKRDQNTMLFQINALTWVSWFCLEAASNMLHSGEYLQACVQDGMRRFDTPDELLQDALRVTTTSGDRLLPPEARPMFRDAPEEMLRMRHGISTTLFIQLWEDHVSRLLPLTDYYILLDLCREGHKLGHSGFAQPLEEAMDMMQGPLRQPYERYRQPMIKLLEVYRSRTYLWGWP